MKAVWQLVAACSSLCLQGSGSRPVSGVSGYLSMDRPVHTSALPCLQVYHLEHEVQPARQGNECSVGPQAVLSCFDVDRRERPRRGEATGHALSMTLKKFELAVLSGTLREFPKARSKRSSRSVASLSCPQYSPSRDYDGL